MNYLNPETEAELNRRRIQEEMRAIHLAEKATRGKGILNKGLAAIGALLVAGGEKLQALNTEAVQPNQLDFSHSKTRKARA
jgi:hypothetical protein